MLNIGDKVKCVFKSSLEIEEGKEYTVRLIQHRLFDSEYIYVNEVDSLFGFNSRSFEKCFV